VCCVILTINTLISLKSSADTDCTSYKAKNWHFIEGKMKFIGHGKAEGVRRRSITGEAQVRSQIFPYGVRAGQSDSVTNFPMNISVLPRQCHSTNAAYSFHGTL
jgi:hypothetical protein